MSTISVVLAASAQHRELLCDADGALRQLPDRDALCGLPMLKMRRLAQASLFSRMVSGASMASSI
jgi:hypothetical protein